MSPANAILLPPPKRGNDLDLVKFQADIAYLPAGVTDYLNLLHDWQGATNTPTPGEPLRTQFEEALLTEPSSTAAGLRCIWDAHEGRCAAVLRCLLSGSAYC